MALRIDTAPMYNIFKSAADAAKIANELTDLEADELYTILEIAPGRWVVVDQTAFNEAEQDGARIVEFFL